MREKLTFSDS
jgi:hypothetical protein